MIKHKHGFNLLNTGYVIQVFWKLLMNTEDLVFRKPKNEKGVNCFLDGRDAFAVISTG